jgi:hypothetical protein
MAKRVLGSFPKPEDQPKRTSFLLEPQVQKKLRYISFQDETDMTAIVAAALHEYFGKWEKKNGKIPVK